MDYELEDKYKIVKFVIRVRIFKKVFYVTEGKDLYLVKTLFLETIFIGALKVFKSFNLTLNFKVFFDSV